MSTAPTKQLSALSLFGAELRHHRLKAGMTLEQFGAEVGYSYGLISQVEHGKRVPQPELAKGADRVFGTDGLFERFQEYVSRLGSRHQDLREYYRREPTATSIQTFETQLVPGLLQTEAYARAVVIASRPEPTADEVEARVATRMTRQDILDQEAPPTLWAIIGEGALHVRVGSNAIMAEQMAYLLGQARRPNVTVQVLSFRAGLGASEGFHSWLPTSATGRLRSSSTFPACRCTSVGWSTRWPRTGRSSTTFAPPRCPKAIVSTSSSSDGGCGMARVDFIGARWRKASASGGDSNCVEVAYQEGRYGLRDSKNPAGAVLTVSPAAFAAFLAGIRGGDFD